MSRKALLILMFGMTAFIAFSLDLDGPHVLGLGFSKGMMGSDSAYSLDLTSPYLHLWGNQSFAVRLSGDVMAKEGVLSDGNTDSIVWPGYFTARLGAVLATAPSGAMRLYAELGATVILRTSALAVSTSPALGFYAVTGAEFFFDDSKHTTMFLEVGNETTFGSPSADKMRDAPILGNGLVAIAGVRYYL